MAGNGPIGTSPMNSRSIMIQTPPKKKKLRDNSSPLLLPEGRHVLTSEEFEKQFEKSEKKKNDELHSCRENFYLKKVSMIVGSMVVILIVIMFFPSYLFFLMPVYRCDSCYGMMLKDYPDYHVTNGKHILNQVMFLFVNWLEVIYLYRITKMLYSVNQDQLNIKKEVLFATISWIFFSVLYFLCNLGLAFDDGNKTQQFRWAIMFGILARNLCTFWAMTLFTLWDVKFKEQIDYGGDQRINNKLNVLNLNIIMTHQLPFSYFK